MGKKNTSEQKSDSIENANGEDIVEISSDSASLNNENETVESEKVEEPEKVE